MFEIGIRDALDVAPVAIGDIEDMPEPMIARNEAHFSVCYWQVGAVLADTRRSKHMPMFWWGVPHSASLATRPASTCLQQLMYNLTVSHDRFEWKDNGYATNPKLGWESDTPGASVVFDANTAVYGCGFFAARAGVFRCLGVECAD